MITPRLRTFALCLIALLPVTLMGQQLDGTPPDFTVEKTQAKKLGQTAPLRDYLQARSTSNDKLKQLKQNKPSYVRNFVGREEPIMKGGQALPKGGDPLVENKALTRDGNRFTQPLVNIEGTSIDLAGSGVPDPNGDVGLEYYVQTVNATWIRVVDFQGNVVGAPFRANAIWSQVGQTSRGDPIILYDHEAGRWFLTEFPPANRVLVAISDTEDPLGTWTAWSFNTPSFPDYPKYGIWDSAYVLTTNEGGGRLAFYGINRQEILAGEDTVGMQRFTVPRPAAGGFITATPVHWIGDGRPDESINPMVMHIRDDEWAGVDEDAIEIIEMDIDWENENNSVITSTRLPVSPFSSSICSVPGLGFSCIPQPSSQGIDGIPFVIMNRIDYRNFATHSSVVLNFAVDVTGENDSGIRWMELRKEPGTDWSVYQEGTVGTLDGDNRFMGGISIDSRGNIGLAYSISSEERFPSLRFTGRLATDPLGEMTFEESEFATGAGAANTDRYGDYASMSVDAQDIFWYTGQYMAGNASWSTKIMGFKLEREDDDIGPAAIIAPTDSPDLETEQLTVAIRNYGTDSAAFFDVGYIFDGQPAVIESPSVVPGIEADSVYEHTFNTPLEFDASGMYDITVFTSYLIDENVLNDTCVFTINKLARNDAQIFGVDGITSAVCDTFIDVLILLRNNGVDTLRSARINVTLNDGTPVELDWTGVLATGELEGVPFRVSGMREGLNDVIFEASLPNGVEDQEVTNDRIDVELNVSGSGSRVVLNLLTDLFPEETSWELLDWNGDVVFEAGPFMSPQTELQFEWCLETDSCYEFVLFDSFGDGLTGYGVDGDFEILSENGSVLARLSTVDFGFEERAPFCVPEGGCTLNSDPAIGHESAFGKKDGFVNLFTSGGLPPYSYSDDGGFTFQASPIFQQLEPGEYVFVIEDQTGCRVQVTLEILECDIQTMFTVQDASDVETPNGSITIDALGGSGALEFSLNGGDFQTDVNFTDLLAGDYEVAIRDSVNCERRDSVVVGVSTSVEVTKTGQIVRVFPNPSDGEFYFEVEGLENEYFLGFQVIDSQGRVILDREAGNFSGKIRGYFVINDAAPGMYFLRIKHESIDRLVRIIKL